jgi:hypothetical protein
VKIEREVRVLTDAHGLFEQRERSGQVALAESQQTDPIKGRHEARWVSRRLGNPERFVPEGPALGEQAQFAMARGELDTGLHGGQEDRTIALAAPLHIEDYYGLPVALDRLTVVAPGQVGCAKVLVRQRAQGDRTAGSGEFKGALCGGDGLVIRPPVAEVDRQKEQHLPQSMVIVEGRREGLGLV